METILTQKIVQDSEVNEENEYPDPDFNKGNTNYT
jgi:hypothetical protein